VSNPVISDLKELIGDFFNFNEEFDFHAEKNFEINGQIKFTDNIEIYPILIFIPKSYFLLIKLSIYDNCSLVKIKTNRFELFQYLDEVFLAWENKN
jgi:hypothetical protein